jgi:spore coat polysaccharide biosynthesis predicted glycosyltransferase SpsG
MGGADSKNVTPKLIDALSGSEFVKIHFDVVIGVNNLNKTEIDNKVNSLVNFTSYLDRPHLADLMNMADISIGGGGTTSWERICVGLPSFIITLADNQVSVTQHLNDLGLVSYMGHYNVVDSIKVYKFLVDEIATSQLRNSFSSASKLCDGMGVNRVAGKIAMLAS